MSPHTDDLITQSTATPHHRSTAIKTQQAIFFANASNRAFGRIMFKASRCNPRCILIIETPAGFLENQPVYYDKFLLALELKDTRFCRCKLYNTPRHKETIVIHNMACWPPNDWDPSRRMCSTSSPCQPLLDNKTRKHKSVVRRNNAALSTQFESKMTIDLARACFVELTLAYRNSK